LTDIDNLQDYIDMTTLSFWLSQRCPRIEMMSNVLMKNYLCMNLRYRRNECRQGQSGPVNHCSRHLL